MRNQLAVAGLLVALQSAGSQVQSLSCVDVLPPSDSGSGRFGDIAEGRNGRLAWTDGRPGQILLRDANGVVRVVGRSGAGPGEFDRPTSLVWRADTLLVSDWRLRRVQAFSDTGRLIRTMTALVPGDWTLTADGRLVTIRRVGLPDESSFPRLLVSQRPEDLSIDTIARFANPAVEHFDRRVGNVVTRNSQPFQAAAYAAGSRDGSRFCGTAPVGSETVLRCTDSSGREVLNRRLMLAVRPLTSAVYDSMVALHLAGGSSESEMRSKIKRPQTLPPVLDLMMTASGEIWLQRSHRLEDTQLWARVRHDGSIRDHVSIPKRYRLIRPDAESVWTATADADGLETLHKCRIGG